jgi:hypothetical protein
MEKEICGLERNLNTNESIGELICSTIDEMKRLKSQNQRKLIQLLKNEKNQKDLDLIVTGK